MIDVESLPAQSKWEILTLIGLWQVVGEEVSFKEVAQHYNPQWADLEINDPKEWIRAISNSM